MKIFKKMKKGFTLVELVVVIAVIAILAAVSVGAYFGITDSANASKLEQEAKQVYTAIQTVALAPNEHSSLTSSGLTIIDEEEFEDKLIETLGHDVYLTNVEKETVDSMPTIYFSSAEYSARVENGFYKSFEYYIPGVTNKKASVDVVTGKCSVVAAGGTSVVDPDEGKVWYLVHDSRELKAGDEIVIAAKDYNYALSTTLKTNNVAAVEIDKDGEYVTVNENTQIITLENGLSEGTFAFNIGENSYLYGGTNSNHLKTNDEIDSNASWNIFVSKGSASIVSQGTGSSNTIKYNENKSSGVANPIFSCYSSGQNDVAIYKFGFYQEFECDHIFETTEPECLICGEPNVNYEEPVETVVEATITEALALEDGTKVSVTGIVNNIDYAWNGSNMSVTIEDDSTDELYIYKLATEVKLGDEIKVTGYMYTYDGLREINEGATADILSEGNEYTPKEEPTVPEMPDGYQEETLNIGTYAASKNWASGTSQEEIIVNDNIKVEATGAKYYDSDFTLRLYETEESTIVISSETAEILCVQFVFEAKDGGCLKYGETIVRSEDYVSTSSSEVSFVVANTGDKTNGKANITDFTVWYLVKEVEGGEQGGTTPHEHIFIEGKCECGEEDPNYVETPVKTTVTKSVKDLITEYGWTSNTTKQSFALDEVVSVKIDGGSNTGKAYDGVHIRIYSSDTPAGTLTFSVESGYELVSLKITTITGTYSFLYIDGTTTDIRNKTVSVSGESVLVKSVTNGSGKQVRITDFEVAYKTK